MRDTGTSPLLAGLLLAAVWLSPGAAAAQSACVSCEGPEAVYSCSVAPGAPQRTGRALQFACIQEIARAYQHTSCSVKRNHVGSCNGLVYMLSRTPAPMPSRPAGNASEQGAQPARKKKSSEPKTVVEFAKRTVNNTKKEIGRSAKKVSKAARSTWRCLSSLFSDC